ncbi:protein CREG2 [Macrotis lagotis]|uniref:protein CREG2 n=1 Tax=Macrotis lagotis TaxID=92651 RepID=UPI003D6874E1
MSVFCCHRLLGRRIMFIFWLSWLLWCSAMLSPGWGYVIVSSVSWSVNNEAEELDSSSNEETLPSLLEDSTSIWKQSYPGSVYKEDSEMRSRSGVGKSKQISSPSRMFSYKRENIKGTGSLPPHEQIIRTARSLAHTNSWGFLATVSTQEKVSHHILCQEFNTQYEQWSNTDSIILTKYRTSLQSDVLAPRNLSLDELQEKGIQKKSSPTKGWMERLTVKAESSLTQKNIIDLEDLRCARLTLTGQMVSVSPEEVEFAKQAVFSRHPVMRKWPRHYEWFFMKMNVENVWLQNWHGGVSNIATEEYFKAVPSKA